MADPHMQFFSSDQFETLRIRKVAELKAELEKLPADRREQLERNSRNRVEANPKLALVVCGEHH